jgi:hypothetical protein
MNDEAKPAADREFARSMYEQLAEFQAKTGEVATLQEQQALALAEYDGQKLRLEEAADLVQKAEDAAAASALAKKTADYQALKTTRDA